MYSQEAIKELALQYQLEVVNKLLKDLGRAPITSLDELKVGCSSLK